MAFLIAAIWLGGKLTYRYGMRVTRQADHDGKLRLDGLAGDWSADSGRAGTPALQGIERLRQLLRSRGPDHHVGGRISRVPPTAARD